MKSPADGRVARAEAKRQARKSEIVAAAGRVFSERGYHNSSIADVIEAARISRGTFYLYFDSREALFLELMESFIQRIVSVVEVVDPKGRDPIGGIFSNLRRVVDVVFDNPELTLLVFRQNLGTHPEVDQKLNRFYGFVREMIEGALGNGVAAGMIREVNRPLVTIALIGAIRELLYSYLVEEQVGDPDRDAVTRELLDFAFHGLGSR
ncbi:MAG: TetR/AcrR family transcriptional regulator [Myxococcales bacterium]|nr:TetR/AcrR family transcriptional regulator [Myxococcales bacterium]MDD9972147.1 TetR/AcrR family transcriptional regulator [Myxococcales bacterium]